MKYSTKKNRSTRARTILIMVLAALTIAHAVTVLAAAERRIRWEPDVEYPMANAHISWEQTFYPGGTGK